MQSQDRTNRVRIERRVPGKDAANQPNNNWILVVTVWASILHKRGLETIKADTPTSVVPASINIGWREGITSSMRVVHGDRIYQILNVLPDLRRREFVDLVCQLVGDGG